ncbi:MAG: hypothetical protein C4306_05350 [Thermoleophilia bacterium]
MPEAVWGALALFLTGLVGGLAFAGVQALRAWRGVRPALARLRAETRSLSQRAEALSRRAAEIERGGTELERALASLSRSLDRLRLVLDALGEARPLVLGLRWLARRP